MIGVFHGGCVHTNGPGKVAINLIKGLKKLGLDVVENQEGDMTGCLASWSPRFKDLPSETLVGPNLVVIPPDDPTIWSHFKNFVVPCQWVKDKYERFSLTQKTKIHTWAVGIDTELFCPSDKKEIDCFLYFKNGSQENRQKVIDTLEKRRISFVEFKYGGYSETDFIKTVQKCRFCILITDTESQGIAYQEILSMGLPCYVINKPFWDYYPQFSCPSTSVPYFDTRCGFVCTDLSYFENFLSVVNLFEPREYILDNLTLEKSASEYVKLLEISHGNQTRVG